MMEVYTHVRVCIGSNIHINSGQIRRHVTTACHSTAVLTLTANEFLYHLVGKTWESIKP